MHRSGYIVMFELSVSVSTAVPPDHVTAARSTPAHNITFRPSRRKKTHAAMSTHDALIVAAVSNGPSCMPSTRNGIASR